MALPSGAYAPRDPAASLLYQIVRGHYETFRAEAARLRDGEGLPRFVEDEFEAFLRCGWHASGFARFRCTRCREERLVAFSCKGRGFCPSCGGRRMTERAAHLVDHVWPEAPVRQWVLTLPPRVRYVLAWRHDLCTAVAGVLHRAVHRHLRTWGQTRGLRDARSGAIIVVQRRLVVAGDGRVVLHLRHPWADGTTHLGFEPTALLERLAVLVPRPRVNLLLYYGVLAPSGLAGRGGAAALPGAARRPAGSRRRAPPT